ncbi:MAG: type II secretion system secretin GspD [Syntrophales bacterium]|nr:type II secretion system secretin GspD [Syntrophales bacterium]
MKITKYLMRITVPLGIVLLLSGVSIGARIAGDDRPVSSSDPQHSVQAAPAAAAADEKPQNSPAKQNAAGRKTEMRNGKPDSVKKKITRRPAAAAKTKGAEIPAAAEGKYVTMDFDNVDIQVFIKTVGEMMGKNFVVDPQVKGNVSVYSPRKISVAEAYKVFESILEVHGYATIPSGDVVKVVPSKDAKEKNIETRLKADLTAPGDKIATQIITLKHANPDEIKRVLDPLISRNSIILSYPPTGMLVITDVLSNIKRLLRIISALDVSGAGELISVVPLRNAHAGDIAKSLTSVFHAEQGQRKGSQAIRILSDDRTNTIIILASEYYTARIKQLVSLLDREVPKGESTMHVYRLQNANAEDLAKVLMNLPTRDGKTPSQEKGKAPVISKEVQVQADKSTNTLVITAARDDYKVLEGIIRSLDVPKAMVYLEALIMEVTVNKDFRLGVEWRSMKDIGTAGGIAGAGAGAFIGSGGLGSRQNPGGYSIFPAPGATPNFPSGFSLGILGPGITIGGVTFPSIGAVVQALQQDQDIHILSTPQIMTMDNEDAEIRVGQNVPYLTRQDTVTATTGVAYNTYEYRDVGVMLKVTPHINEDGFVRLKIGQEVTQIVSQSSGISGVSAPTTLKRTANTTVMVKDSHTVVIGGIIGESTTLDKYQVPCLGGIPGLGALFRTKASTREKTNLFIFLTPRVVRTQSEASNVYQEKRGKMGHVEEGIIRLHGGNKEEKEAQSGKTK